jgi:hypothetical protein
MATPNPNPLPQDAAPPVPSGTSLTPQAASSLAANPIASNALPPRISRFKPRRTFQSTTSASNPSPSLTLPSDADLAQVINAPNNIQNDEGSDVTIDVIPDTRFPIVGMIYLISRYFASTDFRNDPYFSPSSFLGYILTLYYSMMFFTDFYIRRVPSARAINFVDRTRFFSIVEAFLDLPVPALAHNIFEQVQAFVDDMASGLSFMPTLAAHSFFHDFGRIIPSYVFFIAHNLISQTPGNTPPPTLHRRFYATTFLTAGNIDYKIGQLFGSYYDGAVANSFHTHPNWLNQKIQNFINTSSIRFLSNRPSLGALHLEEVTLANINQINPYAYAFGLTHHNVSSISSFMTHVGHFVTTQFSGSRKLSDYITFGRSSITRHLISDPALPTWHSLPLDHDPDINNPVTAVITDNIFATAIEFMVQKPNLNAGDLNVVDIPAIAPPLAGVNSALYRADQLAIQGDEADNLTWLDFDPEINVYPPHQLFDPYDKNTSAYAFVFVGGKIIEHGDLTGIGLPIEGPSSNLHRDNSLFFQGSIPQSKIQLPGFEPTYIAKRDFPRRNQENFLTLRFFYDRVTIPLYRMISVLPAPANILPANANPWFPGFTAATHTRRATDALSVLAHNTSRLPAIPDKDIYLWSSYRWIHPHPTTDRIYLLPTLRHIFGVRTRLHGTEHPALVVP